MWTIVNPGQMISVSAGFIHTCLGHPGAVDPDGICHTPFDLGAACSSVQAPGGYALSTPEDYPFAPAACAGTAIAGTISGAPAINGVNDAKARLAKDGPIVADLYIWDDFIDYTTARAPTYVPDTTQRGPYLHSVCVVGFNADGWIIKNSYGPVWGDGQGFATIAYGACGLIGAPPPAGGFPRQTFAIQL